MLTELSVAVVNSSFASSCMEAAQHVLHDQVDSSSARNNVLFKPKKCIQRSVSEVIPSKWTMMTREFFVLVVAVTATWKLVLLLSHDCLS